MLTLLAELDPPTSATHISELPTLNKVGNVADVPAVTLFDNELAQYRIGLV